MTATGSTERPGGRLVNRSELAAMRVRARMLGVHQAEILIAVAVVGSSFSAVRDYLRGISTPGRVIVLPGKRA